MSHFVAYILQFQEIIVYKIPPGGGGGSIASLRSRADGLAILVNLSLQQNLRWSKHLKRYFI